MSKDMTDFTYARVAYGEMTIEVPKYGIDVTEVSHVNVILNLPNGRSKTVRLRPEEFITPNNW